MNSFSKTLIVSDLLDPRIHNLDNIELVNPVSDYYNEISFTSKKKIKYFLNDIR